MATSLHCSKLSDSKYKNWIKAGLGVLYTKEGIEPFVYDEIEQFQQKCLSDICNNNGLAVGAACSSCCTENVVVCPTNRICNVNRGKCKYHRNAAMRYFPSGCPNKICNNFKNEIQNAHRYHGPSYKNTDARLWCSSPWEVAKCFMPTDGYDDKTSAAETDFNGIISVVINHKAFQSKVKADLSKAKNIFEQGREIGKSVRHSSQLEMEDTDLQQYFTDLQNLLSDSAYLSTNTDAQDAKMKLLQLQNDTLIIGKDDITKVLDDVAKAVQDKVSDVITKAEKKQLELIDFTKKFVDDIQEKGKVSIDQLDRASKSAIDELENQTKESVKKVQLEANLAKKQIEESADKEAKRLKGEAEGGVEQIAKSVDKGVDKLEDKVEDVATKIFAKRDEALKKIEESTTDRKEDRYKKLKEGLKDDLVALYKSRYSKIPLSPLFEEHKTPLVDFYVVPEMNLIEKRKDNPAETPVKSLSNVFKSENSREIYLIADAGFGKTVFSKHLTLTWCQAHRHEEKYKEYFSEDAIKTMGNFEFVFLLLLRDSSDNCSIDDLILNLIIQNLSRSSEMTINLLQEFLHREKCLVILDGLDEWTHPVKQCTKVPKTIPHRNAREKCVILTTTRPWKLDILHLETSEVDKKVELEKLTSESARTLEGRAIAKIKNLDVTEAKILAEQLQLKIQENKLEDLESVPLLAMYLICLWCDDIPFGQSKCSLYASITELLLKKTISKHPEMEQVCEPSQSHIPQCFSEHENCIKYGTYLKALGQLSFETLFGETRERTLVFNKSVAEKYLSQNYLKLSLYSGLLTQSTETTLTKQISRVSFSHKTVQEFFCSLYICCQNESEVKNIILNKCKSLQSILDMSTVFVFVSGMNAEIMSFISRELMYVINNDKTTSEYRTTTSRACDPLKDIQTMFISCMKENTHGDLPHLNCQDIFFGGDCKDEKHFSCLARLTEYNKSNIQSININTIYGHRSLREIIDSCRLHDYLKINKIFYNGRGEEAQLQILLDKSPKCLVVRSSSGVSWSREMLEALKNNSLLQAIRIRGLRMNHDLLKYFLEYLVNRKTFTEIYLGDLSCTKHDHSCCYILDFSEHSVLRKLKLHYIPAVSELKMNSQVKQVELFYTNLGKRSLPREMVNLEHVELQCVKMSATTFHDLVKIVEKLPHEVKVKIDRCEIEPETEFKLVKQYVHISQNLRVTEDYEWGFEFETKC